MKKTYTLIVLFLSTFAFGQLDQQNGIEYGGVPNWSTNYKAPGDSCGVYFNNYIGLEKTTAVFFQSMRTGNGSEAGHNAGYSQRFNCPQPMEVSGIQFYAFETNPLVDSLMAITILQDYTAANDSIGAELARDTVWVTHQAFTINLNDIAVNSSFPAVTVTSDYMVTVMTPTDDSLKIIINSYLADDGNGDGDAFLYYDNPAPCCTSFIGYYNLFAYGPGFDYDILINPQVAFDLNDGFTVTDDTICPTLVNAGCVNYTQLPIYADPHYNSSSATPSDNLQWLWGDGLQNTNILTACHTYNLSGDYTITLNDTLYRHDFNNPACVGVATELIHVIDTVVANFTFATGGIIVDFTSTSTSADSLAWDFGDGNTGGDSLTIQHNYDSLGTFDVWLYAYNECGVDSIMMQVTTDDVGFDDYNFDFNVYPNPANNNVTVNGLIEGAQVDLINILGESIQTRIASNSKLTLDLDELSNGTYFIRVSTENGNLTKKLIVRK